MFLKDITRNTMSQSFEEMQRIIPNTEQILSGADAKNHIHFPQKNQTRGNCAKASLAKTLIAVFFLQQAALSNRDNSIATLL